MLFLGTLLNDTIDGTNADDTIIGLSGDDVISGGEGSDLIIGGVLNVILNVGTVQASGFDIASYATSPSGVAVDLSAGEDLTVQISGVTVGLSDAVVVRGGDGEGDILVGISGLLGSDFSDEMTGNSAANTIAGGAGDDMLAGLAGADVLNGGSGADTASYATSEFGVQINLGAGTALGGDAEGDTLTSIENLIGSSLGDVLHGDGSDNVLSGRAGDDDMRGEAGADTLDGGDGADTLAGGDGVDLIYGGNGNDTLNGDNGNDFLYGQNDNDTLNGGGGNDTLNGQAGADIMTGGLGNDTYFLDSVGDIVNEAIGEGTDSVVTSVSFRQDVMTSARGVEYITATGTGNITIIGMETFNGITGNSGNNYIAGYGGNDTIDAGAGTDFVYGGDGRDLLTGGTGDDTFYYNFVAESGGTVNRRDTITDFGQTAGNDDVIDLRALDAISFNSGVQHFNWLDTGAFTGALGELRYFYDAVNNLTIIEGNTFGDTAPEFQLALQGNYALTAGAAGLGHDILIA
ncbi:MAG: calcium-binding protein [Hyphomicrobiaceae bacterium]